MNQTTPASAAGAGERIETDALGSRRIDDAHYYGIQTVRAQKAELAKREQSLMAEVRKLVEQQNERLTKMGLGAPVQPPPAAVDFALPVTPGSVTPVGPAPLPSPNR